MKPQVKDNCQLGYTPIDPSDVFALSPKLEQICADLGEFQVSFKSPLHTTIKTSDGQSLIQGSMVMPHSPEIVDFELATDYLMTHAKLLTIPRLDGSDVWGDSAAEPNFCDINKPDDLKSSLTNAMSEAPSTLNLQNSNQLKNAQDGLNTKVQYKQDLAERNQPKIEHPSQELIAKCNGR